MKIKGEYERKVYFLFAKKDKEIQKLAKYIKSIYYSIPLEVEDLISYAYMKMLETNMKILYFHKIKDSRINIDSFLLRKIKFFMLSYCNIFKNKNHQILNNALGDLDVSIKTSETYFYKEIFDFLNEDEFWILYSIYVENNKRKSIAKSMNISLFKLKQIENSAWNKLLKYLD